MVRSHSWTWPPYSIRSGIQGCSAGATSGIILSHSFTMRVKQVPSKPGLFDCEKKLCIWLKAAWSPCPRLMIPRLSIKWRGKSPSGSEFWAVRSAVGKMKFEFLSYLTSNFGPVRGESRRLHSVWVQNVNAQKRRRRKQVRVRAALFCHFSLCLPFLPPSPLPSQPQHQLTFCKQNRGPCTHCHKGGV